MAKTCITTDPECAAVPLMDDNCFNGCTIICSSTPTSCFDIPHSVDSFTFEAYFIFFLLICWEVILRMCRFSVSVRKLALSKFVFVEVALLFFSLVLLFFFCHVFLKNASGVFIKFSDFIIDKICKKITCYLLSSLPVPK